MSKECQPCTLLCAKSAFPNMRGSSATAPNLQESHMWTDSFWSAPDNQAQLLRLAAAFISPSIAQSQGLAKCMPLKYGKFGFQGQISAAE